MHVLKKYDEQSTKYFKSTKRRECTKSLSICYLLSYLFLKNPTQQEALPPGKTKRNFTTMQLENANLAKHVAIIHRYVEGPQIMVFFLLK